MSDPRSIIVELLRHMAGRKEVEQYVKHYCNLESRKFAVVKIGGAVLRDQLSTVTEALSFLHQVGLYPIVVHGAGPQLDDALDEAGIDVRRRAGLRVTDPGTLEVVRRVVQRVNLELVEALAAHDCAARPIGHDVFDAELLDRERFGLVGRVRAVNEAALVAAIRAGQLPILTSLGASASGQILNINADEATRALALRLEPHKIIFLTGSGGLLDEHGATISAVNLSEDYAPLMAQSWVSGGMRLKLEQINALLEQLPSTSSVSITSPDHLARELFTHRGAGTLVRRGEAVLRHDSFDHIDRERLSGLLESCFGRQLDSDYFEQKSCYRVYVTESYRATAILTQTDAGIPYLDKFAVTQKAQGEGLGGSLWARMRADNEQLFWRAQTHNAVNGWYFHQADGSYRDGGWTVFWYGVSGFAQIERCVATALALPATLRAHGTDNG